MARQDIMKKYPMGDRESISDYKHRIDMIMLQRVGHIEDKFVYSVELTARVFRDLEKRFYVLAHNSTDALDIAIATCWTNGDLEDLKIIIKRSSLMTIEEQQ